LTQQHSPKTHDDDLGWLVEVYAASDGVIPVNTGRATHHCGNCDLLVGASNGGTESINGLLEPPRRVARGFRNRDNYRLRMLLIGGGLGDARLR